MTYIGNRGNPIGEIMGVAELKFLCLFSLFFVACGKAPVEPPRGRGDLARACDSYRSPLTPECRFALAWYFAPIVYQNTEDPRRDFITRFDFDSDLDPTNQRQHVQDSAFSLPAHVYFAVVEGKSHFFVGYVFYHPVDFKLVNGHENDLEGVLLTVERLPDGPGKLQLMETLAHNNLYQYYSDLRIQDRYQLPGQHYQDRDGALSAQVVEREGRIVALRPEVVIEARGHGVLGNGDNRAPAGRTFVQYEPSPDGTTAQQPPDHNARGIDYALLDLEEDPLWRQRRDSDIYEEPYEYWTGRRRESDERQQLLGALRKDGNARPPWAWDDLNDPFVMRGDWYLAPAFAIAHHLAVPGLTAEIINDPGYYLRHPFLEGQSGGNPPFQKPASTRTSEPSRSDEEGETIHLFDGSRLSAWIPSTGSTRGGAVTTGSDQRGEFLRVGGQTTRSTETNLGQLEARDLWIALAETNSVLLRYTNPSGIPAARVTFRTAHGQRDDPRDIQEHTSMMLLPSLTAVPGNEGETQIDSTKGLILTGDQAGEDLILMGMTIEFTRDLTHWGAANTVGTEVPDHLPALIKQQFRRFLDTSTAERTIDIIAIEILTVND